MEWIVFGRKNEERATFLLDLFDNTTFFIRNKKRFEKIFLEQFKERLPTQIYASIINYLFTLHVTLKNAEKYFKKDDDSKTNYDEIKKSVIQDIQHYNPELSLDDNLTNLKERIRQEIISNPESIKTNKHRLLFLCDQNQISKKEKDSIHDEVINNYEYKYKEQKRMERLSKKYKKD